MAGITVARAQAILDRDFAPWVRALDLMIEDIGPEGARLRMKYGPHLTRIGGMICGQALMSLADTAMVFAVSGREGGYRPMTTVGQTTSMMRPISGVDVIAEARILRIGRTLAFGEVAMRGDGEEQAAVHATTTFAFPPEKK
ncbi:MAG: PaaI family thioesterase [Alphaproteobacteria bacterium]